MSEQPEGFFPTTPQELFQHLRNQQVTMEMTFRDYQNRVRELLDTLSPEHLVTLREMLRGTMESDSAAPYIQGQISSILIYKYRVCVSCGQEHEEGFHFNEMPPEPNAPQGPEVQVQMELPFDPQAVEEAVDSAVAKTTEDLLAIDANMAEYNLRFPQQGEVVSMPDEKPVICKGCGTLYQSLEDRMLRRPGVAGCEGCQERAKWG